MIVCIAEKPSVARDIARILGASVSHDGYMEGNGYQVTWTFGHLCELKNPEEYTPHWHRWDVWDLPMVPQRFGIRLKDDKGIKKQFGIIQKLFGAADSIINCGDAGQEGELIQRWVMQKAGVRCPVQRLWISSMTDEAIREGFSQLKDQSAYQRLYTAGLCRAIGDWLLGLNCTRLYTIKYGQQHQVLSVGRVQTPTLALIVRRQQEIDSFVPEPYWILSTVYRGVTFSATKGKFTSEEEGQQFLAKVKELPFTVTDVQTKPGREAPPRLYDLTSLQVDCNKKFGLTAEQTLQTIQSLYEKKLTTYPRVDTTFLPDDVYPKCAATLRGLRGYEAFTQPLEGKTLPKSKKVFDSSKVTDHHAIIPTGHPASGLTSLESWVYDLVTRAFIAVFYPDCRFLTTTVLGRVADVDFKATGKQITDPGWRVLYAPVPGAAASQSAASSATSDTKEGEEERTLPAFEKGESGPHEPSLQQKMTQPPAYYTEATLLRAMETAGRFVDNEELRDALKENGIGRPSTRAAIIETLFKRRYIQRDGKNKRILATATGIELIGLIREELLKSAELTGIWEKKLREIERGQYDAPQFIAELKQMVTDIVNQVRNDNSNRRVAITSDDDLKKRRSKPKSKTSKPKDPAAPAAPSAVPSSEPASSSPESASAPSTGQYVAGFQPRAKRKAAKPAASAAPSPADPAAATDEWVGLPCPVCGQGQIIKGRAAYGCSRWREGCTFRRPF